MAGLTIHGQAGGTGPQNTNWSQRLLSTKKNVDRRKSRNTNSYTNFFGPYELEIRNRSQIRIRIYVLDVFAVKIRIGPLIFPPIRRIKGGLVPPPPLPMYGCNYLVFMTAWLIYDLSTCLSFVLFILASLTSHKVQRYQLFKNCFFVKIFLRQKYLNKKKNSIGKIIRKNTLPYNFMPKEKFFLQFFVYRG